MAYNKFQATGIKIRPPYTADRDISGTRHDPWYPNDDLYHLPQVGGAGGGIEGTLDSLATAGSNSPYNGLMIGTITVVIAPCSMSSLIGTQVEVVDHSQCIFDLTIDDLQDVWVWALKGVAASLASTADPGDLTPCHWSANDRCCVSADSVGSSGGGILPGGVSVWAIDHTDSPYTLGSNGEDVLSVDASGGDCIVALNNAAVGASDIVVSDISGSYEVILDPFGSDTINGELTKSLTQKYTSVRVAWTGSEWNILG